jgi:hypothetical protein
MSSLSKIGDSNKRKMPPAEEKENAIVQSKKRQQKEYKKLFSVYIVLSCNYPLENDKWGEHSGHETEDTKIIGVFAKLKDANQRAKEEVEDDDDEDDYSEDKPSNDKSLFYWQEDDPCEWTARRVWVEKKTIEY